MYSTEEGQWIVSGQCQAKRVILVSLSNHQTLDDLDDIKAALSPALLHLMPMSVRFTPKSTPFLTSKEQPEEVTHRTAFHSDMSGEIMVEDYTVDSQSFRKMVFSDHPTLALSETPLKSRSLKANDESTEMIPDYSMLMSSYQRVIASGLSVLTEPNAEVLMIGLGGGVLPMFLRRHFGFRLQLVELDPVIHDIARQCFALDVSIPVHITDGVDYVHHQSAEGSHVDVLILDAGGSDSTSEISYPATGFLSSEVLESCKACLTDKGILIMNIVTRSTKAWTSTVESLKHVFPYLYAIPTAGEVNRIAFAGKENLDFGQERLKATMETWHPDWDLKEILSEVEQL